MTDNLLRQLKALQSRWVHLLGDTSWYLSVVPELKAFREELESGPQDVQASCKTELYDFFEQQLLAGTIVIGTGLEGADADRRSVDTVVVHHTSNPPGLRPSRLSAIELIRLYAPYFANPSSLEDVHWKGRPIASGHEHNGQQVFWPYHWIIRRNGAAERLLFDHEIGWHAGDWDVNCRSVGIVFDADLERTDPSSSELDAAAHLIAEHYPQVPLSRILGHREVTLKTECPSRRFLPTSSSRGWKRNLLALVMDAGRTMAA